MNPEVREEPIWDFRVDVLAATYGKFTCNYHCTSCHKDYFLQTKPPSVPKFPLAHGIQLCRHFLKGAYTVHLSGSGEPLLVDRVHLEEIVNSLKTDEECRRLSLTTNGFFLADRVEDLLALGLTDINVSLHALDVATYPNLNKVIQDPSNPDKTIKVTPEIAEGIISRTQDGISKARNNGITVDVNVCVSYGIVSTIDKFLQLSRAHGVRVKLFPLIAVPDAKITASASHFADVIRHLCMRTVPRIEGSGRYMTISWDIDGGTISAKPGDVYLRPYECYTCDDFLRCEESCWNSVRISPWYIQPCGIRKDNIYWYGTDDLEKLRVCLAQGAKLPESITIHNQHIEKVREATSDGKHIFPFIVLEGPDGSGKSLIAKTLVKKLGFVRYVTPPRPFQEVGIKSRLERPGLEMARYLYYLSSNFFAGPELRSLLLHAGVICDRWIYSTSIYHKLLGCSIPDVESLEQELPSPDLTIVFDVSDDVQASRIDNRQPMFDRRWEYTPQIRKAVSDAYRALDGDRIVHVSNDGTLEETVNSCLEVLKAHDLLS